MSMTSPAAPIQHRNRNGSRKKLRRLEHSLDDGDHRGRKIRCPSDFVHVCRRTLWPALFFTP